MVFNTFSARHALMPPLLSSPILHFGTIHCLPEEQCLSCHPGLIIITTELSLDASCIISLRWCWDLFGKKVDDSRSIVLSINAFQAWSNGPKARATPRKNMTSIGPAIYFFSKQNLCMYIHAGRQLFRMAIIVVRFQKNVYVQLAAAIL